MRKTIVAAVTAALVLGGAAVVLAQTEDSTDATVRPVMHGIEEVLDELVADETLILEQADAVIAALEQRRKEFRAEREAVREQLEEFWEDDQLTQEEIEQLPDWHHWRRLDDLLEDGVITREELPGPGGAFGHRLGFGPHHWHRLSAAR